MDLSLLFCGTAASVPTARRGLTAQLLRRGGDRVLFDCGEGTQRQLQKAGGLPDVDAVFLTHLHLDHWFGLPGMLKSFGLRERERPLFLYGPAGTIELMKAMRLVYGRLPYELEIVDMETDDDVLFDGYSISPFNVRHRGAAFGYLIQEDERPGKLDAERAQELGVPFGPELGRLQRGETVNGVSPHDVIGEARPGRRIVISGDTAPCERLTVAAHRADVLVHESTFLQLDADRAAQTSHSTAAQAARTALEAEVTLLALTHVSGRYPPRELLDEARRTFAATELPRDFDVIEIPLPERGTPSLVRPERRPQGAPA